MTWKKKVVWSEGMFLRPQHFQQFERYLETFAHERAQGGANYFWGFHELRIDQSALALGRISILEAQGVLPDGTPFHFPSLSEAPPAIEFPKELREQRIMLALPLRRLGAVEVEFQESTGSLARYRVADGEAADVNSVAAEPAIVQFGEPRLRLIPESRLADGWAAIGALRVVERKPDGSLFVDTAYIPPNLDANRQTTLRGYLQETHSLLRQRADAIAARLNQPGRGGIGEVADFLTLMLANRAEPAAKHMLDLRGLHPERLYTELLRLAGELASFCAETRRPEEFKAYDHDDLAGCFASLMLALRRSLSSVLEQNAFQIPLHERSYGVRVALIKDEQLVRTASFVLAVHADQPAELVRSRFPTQVKIGPVEKIRDLVNLHLPGVSLQALPIAPRQIPYNAGYNYFQLDTTHELWRGMDKTGGLAMHIAGDFPGLALEFWAIRS